MRGRHGRVSLLGVTYVSLLMNVCSEGINTTSCTEQTTRNNFSAVTQMCKSGTVRNTSVVVDTWGTGGPDVDSCTCNVTLYTGSKEATTPVTVQEYPGVNSTASCGSTLRITSTTVSSFTETGCTPIRTNPVNLFGSLDTLTLTLSRTEVSTPWQSGHCILISQDVLGFDLIVTCSDDTKRTSTTKSTSTSAKPSTKPTTTLLTIPTTTTTPTTTTPPTTTTTPPTTTPKPSTTTSATPPTNTTPTPTQPPTVTSTGNTAVESTTAGEQTGSGATTDDIEIGIIAGAAGGGGLLLIIIIVVIVIVIIIRKRSPGNKQPFDHPGNQNHGNTNGALSDDIQSYVTTSTNNRYANNDGDTLTHNSLYVSAGPRDPDTNHIVAGTGDMYAQVQKPEKRSTVDATVATEKLELKEQPQGDVYAVVNKPKKQNKNDEADDNRPSRYTNQDGLVYAEMGVQDMTSRPKSRVTSRPPPVSPKPNTDTENVMYAEINTSV